MPRYAVIDKREGETPLQALEAYRASQGIVQDTAMTYAGRLDPMASGKLLILIGDECKRKEAYNDLDKAYEFEVLFGFSSDTGDILGLADRCLEQRSVSMRDIQTAAREVRREKRLPYPAFSSKPHEGLPLFVRARAGSLPHTMPMRDIRIYALRAHSLRTISAESLRSDIERRMRALRVDASSDNPYKDFRRDDALLRWDELLQTGEFQIARFTATVSSGTYIRSLAPMIAEEAGLCGLAYSIRRTCIGRYVSFLGRAGFWARTI